MDCSKEESSGREERRRCNTEQDEGGSPSSKGGCVHFLFCNILVGPGENEIYSLTCIHVVYFLFLFWFVLSASSLYSPVIRSTVELEPNGCITNTKADTRPQCTQLLSAESITLRTGFALSITFFGLFLLGIKSSPGKLRSRIHQGFWIPKFLLISFLLPASLAIPVGQFDVVWSIFCFIGTFLFRILQSILILDFATSLSDSFVVRIMEKRSNMCYLTWLVCVWLIQLTAFASAAVLYVTFADNCGLNTVLVTMVAVLSTLLTILTVLFSDHRTGLLHSGFVTLLVLFLTLVTLAHENECRKDDADTLYALTGRRVITEITKFVDISFGFLTIAYAGLRSASTRHYRYGGSTISCQLKTETIAKRTEEQGVGNLNSPEEPCFSPGLFFTILGLFSLFMASTLTEMKTSEYDGTVLNNLTIFYLRSLMILTIITIVTWSQIVPTLYPNDDHLDVFTLSSTFCRFCLKTCRRLTIEGCACCNGSTASRRIFTLLFVLGLAFSCLLYVPAVRRSLSTNRYFCTTVTTLGTCVNTDPAYMAVYRVCFAMATFYLLFAVILVCVDGTRDSQAQGDHRRGSRAENTSNTREESKRDTRKENTCYLRADDMGASRAITTRDSCAMTTRDPRIDLQYKAWPVKFCLFFSLLFCSFLLPKEFSRVLIYAGLVGTFLFTILQLALLIFWSKHTSKTLEEKVESSASSFWPILLGVSTILLFLLCLAAVIIFYIFFTRLPLCLTNTIFISLNLLLAVTASVISVHSKIYDAGLFRCFVIVVFSLYLTWSGLSHNPDERCNPVAGYVAEVDMRPNLNIQAAVDLIFTVITVVYFSNKVPELSDHIRCLYEKIRSEKSSAQELSTMESQPTEADPNMVIYNFSLFHCVYFLASLHATMILTNWFIPTRGSRFKLSVNWAAMCVKMTASSLSLVIYIWCIAAQLVTNSLD